MKKATGDLKRDRYMGADSETGELVNILEPEYCTMSRRPGIASDWFEQYQDDLYPKDFITVRGKKMSVPKYKQKYTLTMQEFHLRNSLRYSNQCSSP